MILFENTKDCCGCTACYSVCPKNAISMKNDFKGYLYPEIDKKLCINCSLCKKVCPIDKSEYVKQEVKQALGTKNRDDKERKKSSSGSVFIEFAKLILSEGGIVYGVRMLEDKSVEHYRAATLEEARCFQGSKYVQSDKKNTFREVRKDLIDGKKVLYSGTPCEIAGLKLYLKKQYDNLLAIDIICHGVPSQTFFKSFLSKKEEEFGSEINKITFRNKEYGWRNQELWIQFNNKKVYHNPIWEDCFYRTFTSNYVLRDSCYDCKFSSMNRPGDISIGDYWNIKNVKPKFEDNLGISSLFINSDKGEEYFNRINKKFISFECSKEDCVQHNLQKPSQKPKDYENFWNDYEKHGLNYCLRKYGTMGITEKIRRVLSPYKKKLISIIKKG